MIELHLSLGNHEFDKGISGLTPFIKVLKCPVLAANLVLNREPDLAAERKLMNSIIINVNRTKVGVIGYLTPDTKFLATKNNVDYIEEIVAIKKEISELKKAGVNIFVALGHSGYIKDLEIAREVNDIDLVIGGHTNTFLWSGTTPDVELATGPYPTIVKQKSGRLVPVVQAFAYTKYLGKIHLVFDTNGEILSYDGNPILLDKSIPQDIDVLEIVNFYKSGVVELSETVVGTTSVILDGRSCKKKECNMGNLITDAAIYKYATTYRGIGWTDAPIAIIQGGGVRASVAHLNLPANVTRGDLLTVMPFDSNLVKVTVSGEDIWMMLEYSIRSYHNGSTPLLQVSGLNVEYNTERPSGSRVVKVTVRCGECEIPSFSPLNRTEQYNVLMSSYLALGGDGFYIFQGLPVVYLPFNELESTIEYFKGHSPIYTGLEGRVVVRNTDNTVTNSACHLFYSSLIILAISAIVSL